MDKIDFKKKYKGIYVPSTKIPSIVMVPPMQFAVLKGVGNPSTSKDFANAIEALYSLSYTISMSYKGDALVIPDFYNYTVPPLEGVWDIVEGTEFDKNNKDNLKWTIGIMQPEFVTDNIFIKARDIAFNKKKNELMNELKLEKFYDGLCATMMHIGPYDGEPASFDKMHKYTKNEGYTRIEKTHREIYLNDFRKTAPEKLKTVLRFKVTKD